MAASVLKRLQREYKRMQDKPTQEYLAYPLEENALEWHFTLLGPADSVYAEGCYHGRILIPANYPFAPPDVVLLTPNGRFELEKRICLSISSYHPENWQSTWGIHTVLHALREFMMTPGNNAIGAIEYPDDVRKKMAAESIDFVCPVCKQKIAEHRQKLLASPTATNESLNVPPTPATVPQTPQSRPASIMLQAPQPPTTDLGGDGAAGQNTGSEHNSPVPNRNSNETSPKAEGEGTVMENSLEEAASKNNDASGGLTSASSSSSPTFLKESTEATSPVDPAATAVPSPPQPAAAEANVDATDNDTGILLTPTDGSGESNTNMERDEEQRKKEKRERRERKDREKAERAGDQEEVVDTGDTPVQFRGRLIAFYSHYGKYKDNMDAKVDSIMLKYKGEEKKLIKALVKKYGPEPTPAQLLGQLRQRKEGLLAAGLDATPVTATAAAVAEAPVAPAAAAAAPAAVGAAGGAVAPAAVVAPPPPPAARPRIRMDNRRGGVEITISLQAIDKTLYVLACIIALLVSKKVVFDMPFAPSHTYMGQTWAFFSNLVQ